MAEYIIITRAFSNSDSRREVRERLIHAFLEEAPGRGKDDKSRYKYFVESLPDGDRIYLRRPANLNNGFDFVICLERYNFSRPGTKRRRIPTHNDILEDLRAKKDAQPEQYRALYELILQVHQCQEIEDLSARNVIFESGIPSELILKTLKWFFIEQDVTYWNSSGRDMLFISIPRPNEWR